MGLLCLKIEANLNFLCSLKTRIRSDCKFVMKYKCIYCFYVHKYKKCLHVFNRLYIIHVCVLNFITNLIFIILKLAPERSKCYRISVLWIDIILKKSVFKYDRGVLVLSF